MLLIGYRKSINISTLLIYDACYNDTDWERESINISILLIYPVLFLLYSEMVRVLQKCLNNHFTIKSELVMIRDYHIWN